MATLSGKPTHAKDKRYLPSHIRPAGRGRPGFSPHKIKKKFAVSLREAAFYVKGASCIIQI